MSQSKIYVGNLSYDTTASDLEQLFGQYGKIVECKPIIDRDTGRSKGFAFVTFEDDSDAQKALALDGTEFQSRRLKVNPAKEDDRRRTGGGGGGFGGGRSGGR